MLRRFTLLVLVALLLTTAGCDWSQLGFDSAHLANNAVEPALTASSVQHLTVAWSADVEPVPDFVVADGVVYSHNTTGPVPETETAQAFDVSTGRRLFSTLIGSSPSLPVAVGNGLAYYETEAGITALDAKSGAVRWSRTVSLPSGGGSPAQYLTLHGERLFVRSMRSALDGGPEVAALNTTGNVAWADAPGGAVFGATIEGDHLLVVSFLALDNAPFGVVLLTAYDEATGAVVSRRSIAAVDPSGRVNPPERVALPGPLVGPASGSNVVYLLMDAPNGGELFAVDVTTGSVLWRALPGGVIRGIAVTRDVILAPVSVPGAQPTSRVVAYDPATGAVRWQSTPVHAGVDRPAVAGNLLFTGPQVFDVDTGAPIPVSTSWCCEPVPSEGHLFVSAFTTLEALVPSS